MTNRTLEEITKELIDDGIATEEEICLVTGIIGYNEETLNDILFYRTGYRSLEQMNGEDEDEEE